ncbi:YoaK family protein [Gordonia polyisoprenivorans]|uniref:YoaK family protein n=1 Tax=Gordonia polyisoprenivorans TaxID=84595 RepID=UPI0030D42213
MPTVQTSSSLRFAFLVTCAGGFLDSYTYLARGGAFATAQTGNVVFFAVEIAQRHPMQALAHVWPILAFLVGIGAAVHIRKGRLDRALPHPIRLTVALQAAILAIVGFIPSSAPHYTVTIPIAFVAAMQIEMFRNVAGHNYVAIATTGNLMRLVEAAHGVAVDRDPESRRPLAIYLGVVGIFAGGALIGALTTHLIGVHAAWIPAAFLGVTLALFIWDERDTPGVAETDEPAP